jgi:hypothetical protein
MRGIIYCIKQKEKDYNSPIYIGSTKDFYKRKGTHKSNCYNTNRKHYNIKLYQYIRENGGWNTFEMLEIGVVDYETEEELKIEEQKWINDLGGNLNDIKAYRSIEEKKEYERQHRKQHYEKHKEKLTEKKKNQLNANVVQ